MIQLTRTGVRSVSNSLDRIRREFSERHAAYFPGFLDEQLLAGIHAELDSKQFAPSTDTEADGEVISQESRLDPSGKVARMLWLLLNRTALFDFVRELTGCGPIGCFFGRIYELAPIEEHFDSWHDDVDGNRLIGLSIELGTQSYEGGEFELREKDTHAIRARIENKAPGSVHFFRIDSSLQHHVNPLRGSNARTACAGWFCREPDFREAFLCKVAKSEK